MTTDDASVQVVDDRDHDRLVFDAEGEVAELVYEYDGQRLLLLHTEVPSKLGGRGIGGRLVRRAVEKATAEGLTVVPWCPYARKWLQDHATEASTVTIDWSPPTGS
jgi:predicted GNAT family acetyltransferase